jgi:hypothetical protein
LKNIFLENRNVVFLKKKSIMNTVNKVFEIIENDNAEKSKKEWSTPFFEIVSKDIIKSGTSFGVEAGIYGNTPASAS